MAVRKTEGGLQRYKVVQLYSTPETKGFQKKIEKSLKLQTELQFLGQIQLDQQRRREIICLLREECVQCFVSPAILANENITFPLQLIQQLHTVLGKLGLN